jgi:hypothetical protein
MFLCIYTAKSFYVVISEQWPVQGVKQAPQPGLAMIWVRVTVIVVVVEDSAYFDFVEQ